MSRRRLAEMRVLLLKLFIDFGFLMPCERFLSIEAEECHEKNTLHLVHLSNTPSPAKG